jgi:hypothetical protein
MRVFHDERFQLRVPAPELEVTPTQLADLSAQLLDLRREPGDVRREVIDVALLLVRVGRAMQSLSAEGIFKEPNRACGPLR